MLGANLGDEITLSLDFTGLLGKNSITKLLAMMCIDLGGEAVVDLAQHELILEEERIPLDSIGIE